MPPPRFRVYLRDAGFNLVDELGDWLSLVLVKRFNATGTWSLEIASNSVSAPLLTSSSGIVVRRDNETIFSGSAATELTRTARTLSLAGVDDNVFLEEPARPTPSQASGPYPDEYDVRTGIASTVMRAYVNANIGPAAPSPCRIAALTLAADPLLGTTVTGRANFQSLQALLAELAITPAAGGLGVQILQSDASPNTLVFSIFAPVDRTADAKFGTALGTASDYEDVQSFPDANYWVVMGGDGFGANRTIVEAGDAGLIAAVGRRITGVYDARGTTDVGELNQKLAELLAGAVTSRKTTVEPFEVPSLEFGTDWDFGDLVTVVVEGEERAEVIRDVQIELTNDRGVIVTPMIGDAGSGNDELIANHLKTVKDRLSNLERNWRVPDDSINRAMLTAVLQPPIGQVVPFAGSAAPTGWLLCQGQSLLRAGPYGPLYAAIGTSFGAADGSHFSLPDVRGRVILGVSASHALGTIGGAESVSGPAHTHPGSHSHGGVSHDHTGGAHTHPGTHSHGMDPHRHQMGHDHIVDHTHDHGSITSGPSSTTVRQTGSGLDVATDFHWHSIASNHMNVTSSNSNNTVTGDGEKTSGGTVFTRTNNDSDTGTFGASYTGNTGPSAPNTQPDTNAFGASYSGSIATMMPFITMHAIIYAGI